MLAMTPDHSHTTPPEQHFPLELIQKRDQLEFEYPSLKGHSSRVAKVSLLLATTLGWSLVDAQQLALAASMIDVGMACVPAELLNNRGPLNQVARKRLVQHPLFGARILAEYFTPEHMIVKAVAQHHERLDGSGYTLGLTSNSISDEAKVLAVADVFAALTQSRPYRHELRTNVALLMVQKEALQGKLEPHVVQALLGLYKQNSLDV